jgi:integrase
MGEKAAGVKPVLAGTRVCDLLHLVVEDYTIHGQISLPTVKGYIDNHLNPILGNIRAAEFTTSNLQRYIHLRLNPTDRKKSQFAPAFLQLHKGFDYKIWRVPQKSSINRELAILRRGFKLGMEHVPPLVQRMPKFRLFNESEFIRQGFIEGETYLAIRRHLPIYAQIALVLGYYTGMRLGEVTKFQWSWVDMTVPGIRIPKKHTKNKEGKVVPIFGEMGMFLEMAKAIRDQNYPNCPWVIQENGERVKRFNKSWKTACKAAGYPGTLFHDLRRTFVRDGERSGTPSDVIMQITGHKTRSVHARYNIVNLADLKQAAKNMEDYRKKPN